MNWTATILGICCIALVGILIARPFGWQHREENELQKKNDTLSAEIKSLKTEVAEIERQRAQAVLNWHNCEASQDTHHIPVGSQIDPERYNYVLALLANTKDSLSNARELATKLSKMNFDDKRGAIFDDDYFHLRVQASGTSDPMTRQTDLSYSFSDYQRKKTDPPADKECPPTYVYESFFYGKVGAGYNWRFRQAEIPAIVGLYANISSVLAVDIQALSATYRGGNVDVASRALLQIRIH